MNNNNIDKNKIKVNSYKKNKYDYKLAKASAKRNPNADKIAKLRIK